MMTQLIGSMGFLSSARRGDEGPVGTEPVGIGAVNRLTLLRTTTDTVGIGAVNRLVLLREP